jgi:hypothetical protein
MPIVRVAMHMKENADFKCAFAVGDLVEWSAIAAGSRVTKRGRVVEIVPVNGRAKTLSGDGERRKRDHDSYVIEVSTPLKRGGVKLTRHWPHRAHLRPDVKAETAGARKDRNAVAPSPTPAGGPAV